MGRQRPRPTGIRLRVLVVVCALIIKLTPSQAWVQFGIFLSGDRPHYVQVTRPDDSSRPSTGRHVRAWFYGLPFRFHDPGVCVGVGVAVHSAHGVPPGSGVVLGVGVPHWQKPFRHQTKRPGEQMGVGPANVGVSVGLGVSVAHGQQPSGPQEPIWSGGQLLGF